MSRMQTKLFCLWRCPQFMGVLIEELHCTIHPTYMYMYMYMYMHVPESMYTVDEFRHVPHVINVCHHWVEYLEAR